MRARSLRVDQGPVFAELLSKCAQNLLGRRCGTKSAGVLRGPAPQIDGLFEHSLDFIVGQAVAWLDVDECSRGALIARIDI